MTQPTEALTVEELDDFQDYYSADRRDEASDTLCQKVIAAARRGLEAEKFVRDYHEANLPQPDQTAEALVAKWDAKP